MINEEEHCHEIQALEVVIANLEHHQKAFSQLIHVLQAKCDEQAAPADMELVDLYEQCLFIHKQFEAQLQMLKSQRKNIS